MRLRISIIVPILMLIGSSVWAQSADMRSVFLESPDYVIPALGQTQKQELVRAFDEHKAATTSIKNVYGGECRVLDMTKSYIHIVLDQSTDLQIKLLPLVNNTSVICMVATSTIVPQQSVVLFYDTNWLQISSEDLLQYPELDYFLINRSGATNAQMKSALSERGSLNYLVKCNPNQPNITIKMTTFDVDYVQKVHPGVKELLRPEGVSMEWNKSHFVVQNVQ